MHMYMSSHDAALALTADAAMDTDVQMTPPDRAVCVAAAVRPAARTVARRTAAPREDPQTLAAMQLSQHMRVRAGVATFIHRPRMAGRVRARPGVAARARQAGATFADFV
jgi:hypothetical protein